jgi:O-antigen ligase
MMIMNKSIYKGIIYSGLFIVPFIPFLVSSSLFFPYITSKVLAFRIIVEIIFAAWILLAIADPVYRPKKSPLLYSLAVFLIVIGIADIVGVSFVKSFWSNFERMEGYIGMLHLGAYFLVAGSVLKEVDWRRWWNTSLVASLLMALIATREVLVSHGQRVDGTFGNPTYLAVYMLLHIFVAALFLWKERKSKGFVWMYSLLILVQMYALYGSGTRGAILGLIGGVVAVALLNLRNKTDLSVRKASFVALAAVVFIVGGFWSIRNTQFVQNNSLLSRFANISTQELKGGGRSFVWPMAVKGVKERPLLGWGQENFNYVFSTYYDPAMHDLEPWFDRAHNIFLDWAVAGGILGLISYLSLYGVLLYMIWKPIGLKDESSKYIGFSHVEKSIMTGLVVAYFIHNLFVFDHLVSYILFFSFLAYIHSASRYEVWWSNREFNSSLNSIALVTVVVLLMPSLYLLNVKPLIASETLISAFKNVQVKGETKSAVVNFEKAYNASVLGRVEVAEQIALNSINIFTSDISIEEKNNFFNFARKVVTDTAEEFPLDQRIQLVTGSFLVKTGKFDEAKTYLSRAKEISPRRQAAYFEMGNMYINTEEYDLALEEFRKAYELAPEYREAKIIYLIGAIFAGNQELENRLIKEVGERDFFLEDRIVSTYDAVGRKADVIKILEKRIELDPANALKYRQYIDSLK